ncbi:MAG: PPOX class F420-dependent oxidoreductase [Promethearchaeota archaeon]|jgi:PPOX class probable F420-dependent enzyme
MEGKYISLITFKKNGDPIATQVWFVEKEDKIYFATTQGRYKFKRIKNNPNVKFSPASMRGKSKGEYIDGAVRILSDDEFKPIIELFRKKYRTFKIMFKEGREGEKKTVFFEITPK